MRTRITPNRDIFQAVLFMCLNRSTFRLRFLLNLPGLVTGGLYLWWGAGKLSGVFDQFQQYYPESMSRYPLQFKIMTVLKERLLVFQKSIMWTFIILPFFIEVIWQVYVLYLVFVFYFNILRFSPNAYT